MITLSSRRVAFLAMRETLFQLDLAQSFLGHIPQKRVPPLASR